MYELETRNLLILFHRNLLTFLHVDYFYMFDVQFCVFDLVITDKFSATIRVLTCKFD